MKADQESRNGPTSSTAKMNGGVAGAGQVGQGGDDAPLGELAKRMGMVVEGEALRALSEGQIRPNPELIADGWERRFVADGRRVEEVMELYEQLGFEVRAEPAQAEELGDDCEDCQLLLMLQFKTVYTRKQRD